uniref:SART-1 family protein DOT2 isoform X1 n=1 Tax=Populus alba TaxID=43335 RepID=A0A4U5QQF3_POPAL|nr:SART-1 family protein DOT2 isoform X1 [Populus alba]
MDKKKSKLAGIIGNDAGNDNDKKFKDIRIERTDKFGHVKPGQTSDPRSGFATVDKDLPGGLTPMLGDKKVEHFLGIKRKLETENSSAHQRSLKFESVVEIFCWRTHGSKRDSENLRAHYSVSLTLKGTQSDGYGYFSICFGTV